MTVKSKWKYWLLLFLLLNACSDNSHYAPVTDLNHQEELPGKGIHTVTQGETLYEIAWRYGLDYRYLSERNHINPPYTIFVGQPIHLRGKIHAKPKASHKALASVHYSTSGWRWPTKGKVLRFFSCNNKGIDIIGKQGQPIYATAAGKVVYSGNGLRGYGNLIIIKHNHLYLSAYAHNKDIYVKEGDNVTKGQHIAAMGKTGADKVMLHFEIRRAGKPINPIVVNNKDCL